MRLIIFIYRSGFILFLSCLIPVIPVFGSEQGESYPFRVTNYAKQDYEAESQNWSVTHDSNGIIYVANNGGLLEFDGNEWTFHPAPNGTVIRAVAVDSANRIFTSGYREIGYWKRNDFGELNYHSLSDLAVSLFSQNEEFWTISFADGKVFFHSFTSIFIYDYKVFKLVRPGGLISSISAIDDRVFAHISGEGLYTLEDTSLIPFDTDVRMRESLVYFVAPLGTDSMVIGTERNGMFIYSSGNLTPFLENYLPYFKKNSINRGMVTPEGDIVIGTLLDGVLIFNKSGQLTHKIERSTGMQNNTVLGMDMDDHGNLWVSLDQGIDYINFRIDPSYTIYQVSEIGAVYAAAIQRGILYICSNQGVFYRPVDQPGKEFRFMEGTQGQAWQCRIEKGELLIGHNSGTFRIRDTIAEKISGVSGGMSFTVHPKDDGTVYHSTYNNIVKLNFGGDGWQSGGVISGFNDLIRYIEFDHLDQLWAAHMRRGIFNIQMNAAEDSVTEARYYGEETFGKDYDLNLFKIEGRIVFTTGKMLYTYDDLSDSIIPYEVLNNGLGRYSTAHRIIAGNNHQYWVICRTGIGLFRIEGTEHELIREYPSSLFLEHLITGYENIFPVDQDRAILTMDNGYALLETDAADLSNEINGTKMILKEVRLQGRNGEMDYLPVKRESYQLPNKKNSLYLKYAYPYNYMEDVEYQSFVSGLDNQWSPAGEEPVFSFERIPPGKYEVFTRAVNNWGQASITGRIALTVDYPWYLSKAAFVGYVVLLVSMLLIMRYYLLLRIKRRERHIREAKEKELIRLRNENLNAELSYRSKELANSTMLIIRKNEFLLKMKEIMKRQKQELGSRYPDKYFREIIRRIDKNVSSVDDWKVFEYHFEKAHEKFLQKLMTKYPRLTQSDLRLCAYLRMNLSSKEIAPLLRISVRGVENHRYKLRKKLKLKPDENLTEFILGI